MEASQPAELSTEDSFCLAIFLLQQCDVVRALGVFWPRHVGTWLVPTSVDTGVVQGSNQDQSSGRRVDFLAALSSVSLTNGPGRNWASVRACICVCASVHIPRCSNQHAEPSHWDLRHLSIIWTDVNAAVCIWNVRFSAAAACAAVELKDGGIRADNVSRQRWTGGIGVGILKFKPTCVKKCWGEESQKLNLLASLELTFWKHSKKWNRLREEIWF